MIAEAVAALKAQDFEDWELIIKDGGEHPVRDYVGQDPRIRYEYCPEHPERPNKALAEATGEILNFHADDDLLRPGALRLVSEAIGDTMWMYGQIQFSKSHWVMGCPWDRQRLLRQNYIPCPAVFWRREASEAIGPFDASVAAADWDYWLRLGARWDPVFLPRILVTYREHPLQDTIVRAEQLGRDTRLIQQRAAEGYYAAL